MCSVHHRTYRNTLHPSFMSWVTLLWSMPSALCFTLAGIYLLVPLRQRQGWERLLFSCSAAAAGVIAGLEFIATHAETGARYGAVIRWAHLPLWILLVSVVWFIHLYLRAGRRGWCGLSVACAHWRWPLIFFPRQILTIARFRISGFFRYGEEEASRFPSACQTHGPSLVNLVCCCYLFSSQMSRSRSGVVASVSAPFW